MRKSFSKFALAATLGFALVLTFSCSDGDDSSDDGSNPGGSGKGNDIKNYKTILIGDQTWMAENLNYAVEGSKCNGEDGQVTYESDEGKVTKTLSNSEIQANCDKYGRLYDWATAMNLPASCNSTTCASKIDAKHRGICPSGWHIPSNEDWDKLMRYVDKTNGTESPYSSPTAGRYLKDTKDWDNNGNGENTSGFSALPGGHGQPGSFSAVGQRGSWLSASEGSASEGRSGSNYNRRMSYDDDRAYWNGGDKGNLNSVRCLKD